MPIAKHWAFTIFEGHLLGDIKTIDDWYREAQSFTLGVKYLVFQIEIAPNTGAEHIQGFVSFAGKKRDSTISNLFGKVSRYCFTVMKKGATPHDNKVYCTKEDTRKPGTVPFEFGEVPEGLNEVAEMSKLDTFIEECKATSKFRAISLYPSTYIRHCNGIDRWYSIFERSRASKEREVDIIVCYGNPGSGKSRFAHDFDSRENTFVFPALEFKQRLNLDGYQGQRTVIIDDYKGQIDYGTFKNLTDRYVYDFNTKGSMVLGTWTTLIITSNEHPNRWYEGQDHWGIRGTTSQSALQRRYNNVWYFDGVLQEDCTGVTVHDHDNGISCDWRQLLNWQATYGDESPPANAEAQAPQASSNPPVAPVNEDWDVGEMELLWADLERPRSRDPTPDPSPFDFDYCSETERLLNGEEGEEEPQDTVNLF